MTDRELDALVAEKVMGIAPADVRVSGEVDTPPVRVWNASPFWRQDGRHDRYALMMNADARPYSTDIAAAWQVVEKLNDDEWLVVVKQMPTGVGFTLDLDTEVRDIHRRVVAQLTDMRYKTGDRGIFNSRHVPPTFADTAPLAICKAALAAVGGGA